VRAGHTEWNNNRILEAISSLDEVNPDPELLGVVKAKRVTHTKAGLESVTQSQSGIAYEDADHLDLERSSCIEIVSWSYTAEPMKPIVNQSELKRPAQSATRSCTVYS
jgi:hypothetical protein